AGSRDNNMFEATRRILSVLLRKLDGINSIEKTIVIGATNRMEDLDRALISRFDQIIQFPYPDEKERSSIFSNYAKHLSDEECNHLGIRSSGLTGRNIKDICEQTERRWVRKVLVGDMELTPPPFDYYRQSLQMWKNSQKKQEKE
ncbi:MAG TPA: AAA family ATPase, partial [Spirochaetota bacterium]|nr:AAA family ATPase [Spirochaetota bacterium]